MSIPIRRNQANKLDVLRHNEQTGEELQDLKAVIRELEGDWAMIRPTQRRRVGVGQERYYTVNSVTSQEAQQKRREERS